MEDVHAPGGRLEVGHTHRLITDCTMHLSEADDQPSSWVMSIVWFHPFSGSSGVSSGIETPIELGVARIAIRREGLQIYLRGMRREIKFNRNFIEAEEVHVAGGTEYKTPERLNVALQTDQGTFLKLDLYSSPERT